MLRVDVYSFSEEFEQKHPDVYLWFTYTEGDKAVEVHTDFPEGEPYWIKDLKEHGIHGRKGKNFKLTDKEKFLEELRFEFSSTRMRASKPYEVE